MPFVDAGGVSLHVQELGAGPPVVMLHGLLVGSLAGWYFTVAPAAAHARRVVLFDLRGHGRSERVACGYDVATMGRDLDAVARHAAPGGEAVALVGHSYGALVALRYALAQPERVRALVVVEAPLAPVRFGDIASFVALGPARMAEALPAPLRAAVGRPGRQAARLVEGLRFLTGETTLLADLAAEREVDDAQLARLRCPVRCLYGDRSSLLSDGERLARAIPGASLRVLPGGHYLHVDAPRALTEAVLDALDALDPLAASASAAPAEQGPRLDRSASALDAHAAPAHPIAPSAEQRALLDRPAASLDASDARGDVVASSVERGRRLDRRAEIEASGASEGRGGVGRDG